MKLRKKGKKSKEKKSPYLVLSPEWVCMMSDDKFVDVNIVCFMKLCVF